MRRIAVLVLCASLAITLIINVSGSPTDKAPEYEATTTDQSTLNDATDIVEDVEATTTVVTEKNVGLEKSNSTFRQEEEDDEEDSQEEDKEKDKDNEGEEPENPVIFLPPPRFPIYPHPQLPILVNSTGTSATTTTTTGSPKAPVSDVAVGSSDYSVSRVPAVSGFRTTTPRPSTTTTTSKYKLTNKAPVLPTVRTTTLRTLTFEEEWNLTDIFHIGPQGRADCACGKVPFKVENAEKAGINQYPWTVAVIKTGIYGGGRVHCAGTLVNDKYVLTSSNCVDGSYPDGLQVWLTAHSTFQTDNFVQDDRVLKRDVVEILMHPNYQRNTHDNDVALLKLGKAVDISVSSYYVPICLPAAESSYAGLTARMTVWGAGGVNNGRIYNSRICKEDVPVISNDVCNRDTRHTGKVTGNMMCAGQLTPQYKETCVGDSGGSLMVPNGGRYTLIGVVSWGFQNRISYSPIVFAKVAGYSEWILHNTRDADWCGS